jgi:hypothetical protein
MQILLQGNKKSSTSKKNRESPPRQKSAYELLRENNIARNKKRLFDLGIDRPLSEFIKKKKSCKAKSAPREKTNRSKQENSPSSPASVSDNEEEGSSASESSLDTNEVEEEEAIEEIEKILDYKVMSKGKRKLQIQWSTGEKEWADYDNVQQDCSALVADFMKKYEIQDTPSVKETSKPALDENIKQCNHTEYKIGVTYMPEEQHSYLQPNNELHGVLCALCNTAFVHTEPVSEKQTKPSTKKPMYTCSNRATAKKCLHCICHRCMMAEIKKESSSNGKKSLRCRRS